MFSLYCCYEVWICLFRMEKLNDHIYKALLDRLTSDKFQWHFIQEF